jgi:hypothetical protein
MERFPGVLEPNKVVERLAGLGRILSVSPEIDVFQLSKSVAIVYARVHPCPPCFHEGRIYRRVGSISEPCTSREQLDRIYAARVELHDLDRAEDLHERISTQGYSVEELAKKVNKGETFIRDLLHLEKVPEVARQAFRDGEISKSVCVLIVDRFKTRKTNLSFASTTSGVFATATDFHHSRFFGFFAILAAILAAFFGRAITRRMRTGGFVGFVGHEYVLSLPQLRTQFVGDAMTFMLSPIGHGVKQVA